ncbi:hypothetical protein [Planobispora rosea]|uniref:hypothetical protein n=1 Tax=Planobispora rosea TaxID=35762 RepID=UPI00083A9864|nr:hypothetical protein [Planobispora rosea]
MSNRSALLWWIVAILLAALPHVMINSAVPHVGICAFPGGEASFTGPAPAIMGLVFFALAALLPLLLIGLAAAARRPGPHRHTVPAGVGAGTACATAVAYGYSSALVIADCPADSLSTGAVMLFYGCVGGCVALADRAGRPDALGGALQEPPAERSRRRALPAAAVVSAALPSLVNVATGGVAWIDVGALPAPYRGFLTGTGLDAAGITADRLIGLGLMAVVVAAAVGGGRRARRAAVSVLVTVSVIGVLFTEPLLGAMAPDVEQPPVSADALRLQEEFSMGFLEGSIRLMPSMGAAVSPAWFSLAYGIAAVLVLLHARRAPDRPPRSGTRPGRGAGRSWKPAWKPATRRS